MIENEFPEVIEELMKNGKMKLNKFNELEKTATQYCKKQMKKERFTRVKNIN